MLNIDHKRNTNRTRRGGWSVPTVLLAAIAVVAGAVGDTHAQCQYEVTAIIQGPPCPFGGHATLIGSGMNNHGEVVGSFRMCGSGQEDQAFYWSPTVPGGDVIPLPMPPGTAASRAYDINDHKQIVGEYRIPFEGWFGFMYDMDHDEFHHLPSKHDWGGSVANAINNSGIAAGARSIGKPGELPNPSNAVIWRPLERGAPVEDLGVMSGPNSTAMDINEVGDVVGWAGNSIISSNVRAILWMNGKGYDLGVLPGMTKSVGKHIDDKTEVIGLSSPPTGTGLHFRWNDGKLSPMNPPAGYDLIGTTDMNNSGQITGHIRVTGTSALHPFLSQHGEYHNLNTLTVGDAPSINHGSVLTESGHILAAAGTKAVLLTPIDVPFADLNFDCTVDAHDLLILLENWGVVEGPATELRRSNNTHHPDLNGDGVVDGHDLLILLANWG